MKNQKLKKELSLFTATLYGVGIILGAGIYVLIGQGAGVAGNAIWLSFVVAAIIAAFTGLSYAELASMFPRVAAEYVYTKHAFSRNYLSFIVQWIMIFTLIVSASTVALGFGGYASFMFGISPVVAAAGLLVVLSAINYIGIKESARYNILSTVVEVSGLVFVAIIGLFFIGKAEIDYFSSPAGLGGVLSATALIFFAYIGFEELVNLSEETKNARKVIPKALVLSLGISTLLYILVSVSSISIIGAEELGKSPAPLTAVVSAALPEAGFLMSLIALFATSNTVLVILIVVSRMLYGLACNNTFPAVCGRVGGRKTPYVSVFIVMVMSLVFLLIGGIKTIAMLTDVGIFVVYVFVNASLIRLRYKAPGAKRTFRSPVNIGRFPVLALLGIISSGLMLLHFEPMLIIYEMIVVFVGLVFYKTFTKVQKLHEREKIYTKLFRKSIFTSKERDLIRAVIKYPMKISPIMVRNVKTVASRDTVRKAVTVMNRHKIGSVVVLDKGKVVGIVTERDVLKRVVAVNKKPESVRCKSIMSRPVKTIDAEESVVDAIELMARYRIKKLVVTKGREIAGIITATDILRSGERIEYAALKKLAQFFPVYQPAAQAG
ncbi:MAG: amino acid permease [Candidatus Aenigmarchaeota archaeon]|nr:amino acid permease [Candidatus Aenigmarchaeota archaeon]